MHLTVFCFVFFFTYTQHFKTWEGLKFDYHGECDLVLINNPFFKNPDGEVVGLRLHARTIRIGYFSYFSQTALQIGDDVLVFENDVNNFMFNGMLHTSDQKLTMAGFDVWLTKRAISVRLQKIAHNKAKIDFYERDNGMPYFDIDGGGTDMFQGSLGLLGDWEHGQMTARDGSTILNDATEFALEWQVRDTEPMLFSSVRAPQYPAQCLPPKKMLGKRLGDSHMLKAAQKACTSTKNVGDIDNCIFDVMATRNLKSAEAIIDIDDVDMGIAK